MLAMTFAYAFPYTPDAPPVPLGARADIILAAYFAVPTEDRTTEAHDTVTNILSTLKPHHRAALAMRHTPRSWPGTLTAQFGKETSLAVRLYCAAHPAVGSTSSLEAAASVALDAHVQAGETDVLDDLYVRALEHFDLAEGAFHKALVAHRMAAH